MLPEIQVVAEKVAAQGRKVSEEDLAPVETAKMAALVKGQWATALQKLSTLPRLEAMPTDSEAIEEIRFWTELDAVLKDLEKQLERPEVDTMLKLLRKERRWGPPLAAFTQVSFSSHATGCCGPA